MALTHVAEVRAFLQHHQPMPGDLDDAFDYDAYGDVIRVLCREPDADCAELFLRGLHSSCNPSVIQSFDDVLLSLDRGVAVDLLIAVLKGNDPAPKEVVVEYLLLLPDARFIEPLSRLLRDPASCDGIALWAEDVLQEIFESTGDERALVVLRQDLQQNPRWDEARDIERRADEAAETMRMERAVAKSEKAFHEGNYALVVHLLGEFAERLPPSAQKRLTLARKLGQVG